METKVFKQAEDFNPIMIEIKIENRAELEYLLARFNSSYTDVNENKVSGSNCIEREIDNKFSENIFTPLNAIHKQIINK